MTTIPEMPRSESDGSHVHFSPEVLSFSHKVEHSKFFQAAKNRSRWLEWSERQRNENIKKKEEMQKLKEDESKCKVNMAVIIKARKESLGFLHGNHIQKLLAEDSTSPLARATAAALRDSQEPEKKNRKDGKNKAKGKGAHMAINQALDVTEGYTDDQLKLLHTFWDHWMFTMLRPVGVLLAVSALLMAVPPVFSTRWLVLYYYNEHTLDTHSTVFGSLSATAATVTAPPTSTKAANVSLLSEHHLVQPHHNTRDHHRPAKQHHEIERTLERIELHGLWYNCSANVTSFTPFFEEGCKAWDIMADKGWQSSIIGTLMFALAFGMIAVTLTVLGLRSSTLSRRIYYFHSAGEIYFVSAVCSTVALVAFPAVMELSLTLADHEYGIGYYLAWGTPLCFYVSAFCMSFDDILHSFSRKGCCSGCACGSGGRGSQSVRQQQRGAPAGGSANGALPLRTAPA